MKFDEFVLIIKKLTTLYRVNMTDEEVASWYERLKDIRYDVLIKTIEKVDSKMMPNAIELEKLCQEESKSRRYKILDIMWKDGYFKYGSYGELPIEQQDRNYEKAVHWLDTGIIPEWFLNDMKDYERKQLSSNDKKRIGAGNGRTNLQLSYN